MLVCNFTFVSRYLKFSSFCVIILKLIMKPHLQCFYNFLNNNICRLKYNNCYLIAYICFESSLNFQGGEHGWAISHHIYGGLGLGGIAVFKCRVTQTFSSVVCCFCKRITDGVSSLGLTTNADPPRVLSRRSYTLWTKGLRFELSTSEQRKILL